MGGKKEGGRRGEKEDRRSERGREGKREEREGKGRQRKEKKQGGPRCADRRWDIGK
jgi:hypothetical protein